jgi:hypothetical protein
MPAGNQPLVLDEVVLVGKHPDHDYLDVVVLGTNGTDQAWQAALGLAGVALSSADARRIKNPGVVVIDVRNDSVRMAKALRRLR